MSTIEITSKIEALKDLESLIEEAKAEAEAVAKAAEAKAEDIAKNAMTEITLAGRQAVSKIKNELAEAVIFKTTGEAVNAATADASFVKDMLLAVAQNWNSATTDVSLKALLSEEKRAELDAAVQKSAAELLKAGVEVGTELAWDYAQESGLPAAFFINKFDDNEARFGRVLDSLAETFCKYCFCI